MGKLMRAIGMMSGTSLDGIDVAYIETDGEDAVHRGPAKTFEYDAGMRKALINAIADARDVVGRNERPGSLKDAELALTEHHAAAFSHFVKDCGIDRTSIDVIGFHGQTVLHRPDDGLTVQLGLGEMLADFTRCPVIYDMRAADVAAGGQGAPLVPAYHKALVSRLDTSPAVIVNIGGVANVTYVARDGSLVAFDTGPGNALIDDWMAACAGLTRDQDGAAAARGLTNRDVLLGYLKSPFFADVPPKSLDRNAFSLDPIGGLSLEDGAATLAALTAQAIAKAREHIAEEPQIWIVCGGGRKNRTIMKMLAEQVQSAVVPAEAAGLDGDSIEAEAWGYLAVRSIKGLPLTFPGTTGVFEPMPGGIRADPKGHLIH